MEPANRAKGVTYDPTAETMRHDSVFSALAPGIVTSGSLAHKFYVPGDHTTTGEHPSGLKGD